MGIIHKVGDSIKWELKSLQSDGITVVDWSGYHIEVQAINKVTGKELFKSSSLNITDNNYITTDNLDVGVFKIVVKNTDNFSVGDYSVDIKYISPDGFKQSSKSIQIKVVTRL